MKYFQILLLLGINISTILLGQSIELPQKFMNKDEIKNIPIFIYDAFEMTGVTIKIAFDSNVIQFDDLIIDPLGIIGNSFVSSGVYSVPDTIKFSLFSLSDLFTGSGMIAQISFQSVGQLGEYSILEFKDAEISGTNPNGSNDPWQMIKVNGSLEIVLDGLFIAGQDIAGIGAPDTLKIGMCDGCIDGWKYGEDEYEPPDPPSGEFTNINFYQLDWFGQEDENGNVCNQIEFSSDYRKQHSFRKLISWGVSGRGGGGVT